MLISALPWESRIIDILKKDNKLVFFKYSPRWKTDLGANHLTLEVGGGGEGEGCWWFWKKISCKHLSEKKIACSTNVIESLWEKREKNILPTRLLEKKIIYDQKSPTPHLKN